MSEVETQESKKTVVAFITGLLIGGLLVWVFSSTPEKKEEPKDEGTDTEQVEKTDDSKEASKESEGGKNTDNTVSDVVVTGKGSIAITDQKAGGSVTLGTLELPTKNGWVVVRDFKDGVAGNILGAARYSVDEGLIPTSVELMRATTKDNTYQASFFTNEGNKGFALGEDKVIDGTAVTFKAN